MITKHLYKSYSSFLFPNLETEKIRVEFNFKENMKKLVITEEQFNKNIKKLLNEKLHVSDEVIETKNMIANLIKQNVNLTDNNKITEINGIRCLNDTVIINHIFNSNFSLTINYHIYLIKNNGNETETMKKLNLISSIDCTTNILTLNSVLFNIDGFDVRTFDDALQHELEHYYQFIKKGGTALIKNRNLYDLAKDNLQSQDNDGFNQILAQIIYLSFKQEHDGYLNGAYATVMWTKPQSKKEVDYYIQQTEIFQVLQMLSYNKQILIDNENNENLLNALRVFNNKKLNWFLRTSDYSIKRITKNIQGLKKLCYEKLNF